LNKFRLLFGLSWLLARTLAQSFELTSGSPPFDRHVGGGCAGTLSVYKISDLFKNNKTYTVFLT
jgi:hypothetical protein